MKHFLNDIEITPRNRTEIGILSAFTGDPEQLSLNVDTITLPREEFDIVQQHVQSVGLFEGIPYRVEMDGGIQLEYFVDLTADPVFRSYEADVKIMKRGALDAFRERAKGTSFELMLKKGVNFNTFDCPYIIQKDNQLEIGISLGISLYIMTRELIQAIKDLATTISQGVLAAAPGPSFQARDRDSGTRLQADSAAPIIPPRLPAASATSKS